MRFGGDCTLYTAALKYLACLLLKLELLSLLDEVSDRSVHEGRAGFEI